MGIRLDKLPIPRPGDVKDHWVCTYDFDDGLKGMFRGKRFDGHELLFKEDFDF